MKNQLTFTFLVLLFSFSCHQEMREVAEKRPNILLIMSDDQGYGDLGFHGNPDIRTPVLDAFARESIRFSQFYVSPVCAPTRSSLMTGRYSLRTGVSDTYNGWARMASEEKTIAELLHDLGYSAAVCGKWHLGDNYPCRPNDQGFDYSLVHQAGGMGQVGDPESWFRGDSAYFDPVLKENGKSVQKQGYCTDIFTDAAIDFIRQHRERPFFCYLAFNAPHTPLQLPDKYEKQVAGLAFDPDGYAVHERAFPDMSDADAESARRVYGMVSNIDDNVGRLLNTLDELGLHDNTLVIFMTDNGPQQVRYNGGLRGLKGSVYEGGIRVPFFLRYPEKWKEGKDISVPAAHIDILPSILDICGSPFPKNLDGKSLVPLLDGQQAAWADRPLYFYWTRGFPELYRNIAVRQGNYKLVGQTGHEAVPADFELFDLSEDPSEMHDISEENTAMVTEMKQLIDGWYQEMIRSPHLDHVPIVIGSDEENPVLLNRNDAKGSWGIWAQTEIYGYWDVTVANNGKYQVKSFFEEPLPSDGVMKIRIGKIQIAAEVHAGDQEILMRNIPLEKGNYRIEAGYRNGTTWKVDFPFYIEIERTGE